MTGIYNDGIPADSRVNLPGYEWLKKSLESPEASHSAPTTPPATTATDAATEG